VTAFMYKFRPQNPTDYGNNAETLYIGVNLGTPGILLVRTAHVLHSTKGF